MTAFQWVLLGQSSRPTRPTPRRPAARPAALELFDRARRSAVLFSGWTWVAAGSLVGFEVLDLVFGTAVLMPELLPVVILALALAWYFRQRIRTSWARLRARIRLRRLRRRAEADRRAR